MTLFFIFLNLSCLTWWAAGFSYLLLNSVCHAISYLVLWKMSLPTHETRELKGQIMS